MENMAIKHSQSHNLRRFYATLGPGLLYAGAAIGVSHLVQSTRAGADFGFELMWILLAANILKYPFFEFAGRYVLATGDNLIKGYFDTGKWALYLFLGFTLLTMFPIQAALTMVTAGLANNLFDSGLTALGMSAIIMALTLILLVIGRFKLLDTLIKLVIVILSISTITAVIAAAVQGPAGNAGLAGYFDINNKTHLIFLIAFIGWMPAPIDLAVWGSLWSQAKNNQLKQKPSLGEVLTEFRIGYFGTMAIAAAFLTLGALVMHGAGESLSPSGAIFADQLVRLYTSNIGSWAYPVIAVAALTTMLSTTLTVTDAYPRVLRTITQLLFPSMRQQGERTPYIFWIVLVSTGGLILISMAGQSMRIMVDLATTLSFITAPVLAYINLRVITSNRVPKHMQPGKGLRIWAWVGIVFLGAFTLVYLAWLLFA
jgi:Mn2+/Fe2+ NRAMP family transporter